MSKLILQDKRVMNLVLESLIGKDAIDCYVSSPCEWIDGRHADILYTPILPASEALPPVIIEIQNVVDKPFIRRLIKYCSHVIDTYQVEPVALTICVNSVRKEVKNKLQETNKATYMKKLASDDWAQAHYFISEETIRSSLEAPLSPMVALSYVMIKQQVSIIGLEHRNDPTVQMLYSIAKEVLDHQIHKEEKIIDVLLNVCHNNRDQYKRIIEALEEDCSAKRARLYADDGLLYAEACIRKYNHRGSCSTMSEPLDLPEGVTKEGSSSSSSSQNPLRVIEPDRKMTDLEWAGEFIKQCKDDKIRMNWQVCFAKGREAGFFETYANAQSLKSTYNGQKLKK
ncbi:uncharacterized protein BX663DRAFT_508910 [Cokeromyces recurvatus]|uniref:uncharacterized protein n=1 Tax=Cokeromyces recurvatus TaxID=90255 RepID=UPI00221FFDDC|nr:uncharacterized protein BX663DRAFT_508910 [Cokeromyces recurvatus]KAI7902933.1 hypothetical protein BX663DRAFT_508910 [Cokeromyces recurvatus]